jgi:hypothetical protein
MQTYVATLRSTIAEMISTLLRAALLAILLLAALLLTRVDKLTSNVHTLHLVAVYYLDYHTPIHAVALACPGVDYI